MTAYVVYTRQLPTGGSGRWYSERDVFLIWGPITQIKNIKTIATVGSSRGRDLKAQLIGSGDSRSSGARSGVGQAIEAAHRIAEERGYAYAEPTLAKFRSLPGYRDTAPREPVRQIINETRPFPAQRAKAEALGVHPRHSGMSCFSNWSTLERTAAAVLVLYRQGLKVTPGRVSDLMRRVYQPAIAAELRAFGGPDAVTMRVGAALGWHPPPTVEEVLSGVLESTLTRAQEARSQ